MHGGLFVTGTPKSRRTFRLLSLLSLSRNCLQKTMKIYDRLPPLRLGR
jgi:hypothetical protein